MSAKLFPTNNHEEIGKFLTELNESFSIIIDLEQLKDNFAARLKTLLNTEEIFIFLLNPDLNRYIPVEKVSQSSNDDKVLTFFPSDKLIFWLSVNKTFLNIDIQPQVFAFLSQREQDLLTHLHVSLVHPFIVMNQVKGMVFIGKRSGNHYEKYEMLQLKSFFDQAGFAFENAFLYQLQKDRTRKMYRADRLATLGELAAGAAHEIRNPLTSIRSSIQYLKRKLSDKSDIEVADGLISEVDRINEIIEGLLSFSKPQMPKKEKTNLKALLTHSVQMVSNTALKAGVDIMMNYDCQHEEITVDSDQLKQVFLNVIMNAIQAFESPKGLVTISVNEITTLNKSSNQSIKYIIEIADQGKGIDPEYIDKIFDPFFTTKAEGTGLGLSISYGIINRHGGDIEIFSELGRGARVRIKIPMNEE